MTGNHAKIRKIGDEGEGKPSGGGGCDWGGGGGDLPDTRTNCANLLPSSGRIILQISRDCNRQHCKAKHLCKDER